MNDDQSLTILLRMKDEASAVLKGLEKQLQGLATQTGATAKTVSQADTALGKMVESMTGLAARMAKSEAAALAFNKVTGEAASTMNSYARAAGAAGEVLQRFGPAGAVAAAGMGALALQVERGLESFIAFERQGIRLQSSLIASGQAGKATFAQLHEQAAAISRGTIFDEASVTSAMASLVRNGMLTADKVRQMMPRVLDFAAASGQSPEEAAKTVAQMYSNPEHGIRTMARSMGNLTSVERQRLERQVQSGDLSGAADALFNKLAARNQDQARMLTQGIGGAYQVLTNEVNAWAEQSRRSFGQAIADAVGLEGQITRVTTAVRSMRDAQENRDRGGANASLEDRIASTRQSLRDATSGQSTLGNQTYYQRGPGGGLGAAAAYYFGSGRQAEDLRSQLTGLYEQQRELDRAGAMSRDARAGGSGTSAAEQRKQIDLANDYLVKLDPVLNRQRELNVQIEAFQRAVEAAGGSGSEAARKYEEAIVRLRGEVLHTVDAQAKLIEQNRLAVRDAGLSGGNRQFQTIYDQAAFAVGERYHLTPAQLQVNPAFRMDRQPGISDDKFAEIMAEVMRRATDQFRAVFEANFAKEQEQRTREIGLILQAMEPGRRGQDAQAQLQALRTARDAAPVGSPEYRRLYERELANSRQTQAYQQSVQDRQEIARMQAQTDALRLQAGLLNGTATTVTIPGASLPTAADANGVASQVISILRTKYGATDSAIAAVLGNMQRESGFTYNKPGDQNAAGQYTSYGLLQWHDGRDVRRRSDLFRFAGTTNPSVVQQMDFMMQEINTQPQLRAMWQAMQGGSVDFGAGQFARIFGRGSDPDRDARVASANSRLWAGRMSGSGVTSTPATTVTLGGGAPVGEADARTQTEIFTQAMQRVIAGTSTWAEALKLLTPQITAQADAQRQLALAQSGRETAQKQALNAVEMRGGAGARREAEWQQQAFNQGYQGADGDRFVAARRAALGADNDAKLIQEAQAMRDTIALTEREVQLVGALPAERQRELDLLRLRQRAVRDGLDTESAAYKQMQANTAANADAADKLRRAQGPLGSWITEARDSWKGYQQAAVSALDGTATGLAAVLTGTQKAGDAARSLVANFAQLAASTAFKSVLGTVIGGALGSGGSPFDGAGISASANGNVLVDGKPIPLRQYAAGGIATSPQLALYGEGKSPAEAFVPLPDGRSIPVSIRGVGGKGGGTQTNTFNVSVNVSGGGSSSGAPGGGGDPAEIGQAVAAALHNKVVEVMIEQQRLGGSLNPAMG